jgi:hypothetical protein
VQDWIERWGELAAGAERSIAAAPDLDALERERVAWLGRSG